MSRQLLEVAALIVLLVAACTSTTGLAPSRGTIVVGADLPLSGTDGAEGQPVLAAIRFAISRQGRLRGYDVQLVSYDDTTQGVHDPDAGAIDIQRLAANPQVLGVIGPFNASVAVAEIPIAAQAHLVLISPATTNECLTKDLAYCEGLAARLHGSLPISFFRVSATDDLQGPVMAGYALTTLGITQAAVLSDSSIYGKALADGFQARFATLGGASVARLDFDPSGGFDSGSFLRNAQAAGAAALYYGGVVAGGGCKLRSEMTTSMPRALELGGEGFALDTQCIQDAGSSAAGMYGTSVSVNADDIPSAQSTVRLFRQAHPAAADYSVYSIPAYDATRILLAAIGRAIDANGGTVPGREDVRAQVASTKDFPSTVGPVTFDSRGDTSLRYVSIYETRGIPVTWTYVTQVRL